MLRAITDAQTHDELRVDLDAIVWEGALVRAGARFERGVLVERPPIDAGTVAA